MKIIQIYGQVTTAIAKYTNSVGITVLLAIALLTTADVICRYIKHPIPGAFEIVEAGLVTAIFFGIAYTGLVRGHISIKLLSQRLPARAQVILDIFNRSVMIVIWGVVAWQGYKFAIRTNMVISDVLEINLTPVKMLIPFGSFLFILVLIHLVIEDILQLRELSSQKRRNTK